MKKIDGKTSDLIAENIEKLKQLFPEIWEEGKVDLEMLKKILGEKVETERERYSFSWHGKSDAIKMALKQSTGTLRPKKAESKDWDKTNNLYIEGDNLEVLRVLQDSYRGKVKMIYIDPPYNTGKDFVYEDNFADNIQNYKEKVGDMMKANADSSGRKHTNWLNMMYPRLRLARNLLKDDGVIFISIDDNEQANLKKVCDEIFGEENRLSTQHIQVRYANKTLNEKNDWQPVMEYVYIYAKNANSFIPKKEQEKYSLEKFVYEFEELTRGNEFEIKGRKVTVFKFNEWRIIKHKEPRIGLLKETWVSGSIYTGTGNGEMVQNVIEPRVNIDGYGALYKIDGLGEDGMGYRYFTGPQTEGATRSKMFSGVPTVKIEEISKGVAVKSKSISNFNDYSPDFGNIVNEGGVKYNSGKKPVKMLLNLIEISNLGEDDIVLDFFAGSATTAHAVMQLNAVDGVNRKFIMVQIPELISPNIKEQKDTCDFLTSINKPCVLSELGKERMRRAGEKIVKELREEQGKLIEDDKKVVNPEDLDIGFKVFELDETNFTKWDPNTQDVEKSMMDQLTPIKAGRADEDAVYEIMLKYGVDLTMPIEELKLAGKKVFSLAGNYLLLCLEKQIGLETVGEMAKLSPHRVVFFDDGFADDTVKANAEQTLKKAGVEEILVI